MSTNLEAVNEALQILNAIRALVCKALRARDMETVTALLVAEERAMAHLATLGG